MHKTMDLYCRVAILEAAAGLPPGSWSGGNPSLALGVASEHFGNLEPAWVADRNQGLYGLLVKVASAKLPREDAQDLVARIISGLTLRRPGGELAAVGEAIADQIKAGSGFSSAKRLLVRHTASRAKSISDSRCRAQRNLRETNPLMVHTSEVTGDEEGRKRVREVASDQTVNGLSDTETLLNALSDPNIRPRIIEYLRELWSECGRASDQRVMLALLDNPDASGVEIARLLGVSRAFVSDARKRMIVLAQESLAQAPPDILGEVNDFVALGDLGYGTGTAVDTHTAPPAVVRRRRKTRKVETPVPAPAPVVEHGLKDSRFRDPLLLVLGRKTNFKAGVPVKKADCFLPTLAAAQVSPAEIKALDANDPEKYLRRRVQFAMRNQRARYSGNRTATTVLVDGEWALTEAGMVRARQLAGLPCYQSEQSVSITLATR